ncbi:UNVERIFIED_CONTAM: hypothetical protein PYX00_002205 [Menopon gallinae]|uniref:Protein takeout n=1 Tax=Menopon gallinae TaxID=328185 RepID=A0AAW2IFW8_9NEOP
MISFSVLVLCAVGFSTAAKLPSAFPKCKRTDPNLEQCLVSAVSDSVPTLVKGVPNLGLIPIDPLRVTRLDIDQGDGPVALDLKFRDIDIINIGSVKVNSVKADIENYKIEIDTTMSKPLIIDGDYEIDGKVLVLPITGKGKSHLELDNVHSTLYLQGKEVTKDGRKYMELVDLKVKFETTRLRVNFENLFNNDKALGNQMNAFLNENWKEILQEIQPAVEEALGQAFKEIARRLFSKVPYDDIFLK